MKTAQKPRLRLLIGLAVLALLLLCALGLFLAPTPVEIEPIDLGVATQFDTRMAAANAAALAGRIDEAVGLYRRIAADAEMQVDAFKAGWDRARALLESGQHAKAAALARELCEQCIANTGKDPRYKEARSLAQRGNMQQAAESYLELLDHYSLVKQIGHYIGQPALAIAAQYQDSQPDLAETEYRSVIQKSPLPWQRAEAQMGLGEIMLEKRKFEESLQHFELAADLGKDDASLRAVAYKWQAKVRRKLGQFDQAERLLDQMYQDTGAGQSTEQEFLDAVDEHATAVEASSGPLAAARMYLHVADKFGQAPDWETRWYLSAARTCQRADRFDQARLILGRLQRIRIAETDPDWIKARTSREELDEAEKEHQTTAFLEGVLDKVDKNGYRCVIVENDLDGKSEWSPEDGDYLVNGRVALLDGATLTIRPGTTVKFTINSALIVYGALQAQGQSNARIVFESSAPNPSPFDWGQPAGENARGGIQFVGQPGGQISVLSHCIIRHASVGVLCDEASPRLANCTITGTGFTGLDITAESDPSVSFCLFSRNDGDALQASQSSSPIIEHTGIVDNGGRGMVFGRNTSPLIEAVTVSNNAGTGVLFYDSATGSISNSHISRNDGPGIHCDTSSAPLIANCSITGNRLNGVLASKSATPRLVQCSISRNAPCGVLCETSTPVMQHCSITDNKDCGIRFTLEALARLDRCTISNNPVGLMVEYISKPRITNSSLHHNGRWNVVMRSEKDLDLAGNWWGMTDLETIRKTINTPKTPGAARVFIEPPLAGPPNADVAPGEKQ